MRLGKQQPRPCISFCPPAPQLVHSGKIDFLVADYLSEITMSLLTAAKQKSHVSSYLHPKTSSPPLEITEDYRKLLDIASFPGNNANPLIGKRLTM